ERRTDITLGRTLHAPRQWWEGSGAKFWAGQVHAYTARPANFALGLTQVFDHPEPGFSILVSTVDAHAVHAVLEQVAHQDVVIGRLTGYGNHDPRRSASRGRS